MIRNAYRRLARPFRPSLWTGCHAVSGPEPRQTARETGSSLASACEFDYAFYAHLAAARRRPARR